jgi:small Trp-rich protein
MWLVVIGVVLLVMNLAGIGPVGAWAWGWDEPGALTLLPFVMALAWWYWSDVTGRTQRQAMDRMAQRKEARRQKSMEALGTRKPGARKRR